MKVIAMLLIAAILLGCTKKPSLLNEILSTKEDDVDLATVDLALAKRFVPDLDIDSESWRIEVLAEQVRKRVHGSIDPLTRIKAINTVLYRIEGFHYNEEDHRFVHLQETLNSRRGNCLSLAILYLAVAQRLGYPIYPIIMPGHIYLKYICGNFQTCNIEPTNGGNYLPDEEYLKKLSPPASAVKSGVYGHLISYRQFISTILISDAESLDDIGHKAEAANYLETAVKLYPRCTLAMGRLAGHYEEQSRLEQSRWRVSFHRAAIALVEQIIKLGDRDMLHPKAGTDK